MKKTTNKFGFVYFPTFVGIRREVYFCTQCDNEIDRTSNTCPSCGAEILNHYVKGNGNSHGIWIGDEKSALYMKMGGCNIYEDDDKTSIKIYGNVFTFTPWAKILLVQDYKKTGTHKGITYYEDERIRRGYSRIHTTCKRIHNKLIFNHKTGCLFNYKLDGSKKEMLNVTFGRTDRSLFADFTINYYDKYVKFMKLCIKKRAEEIKYFNIINALKNTEYRLMYVSAITYKDVEAASRLFTYLRYPGLFNIPMHIKITGVSGEKDRKVLSADNGATTILNTLLNNPGKRVIKALLRGDTIKDIEEFYILQHTVGCEPNDVKIEYGRSKSLVYRSRIMYEIPIASMSKIIKGIRRASKDIGKENMMRFFRRHIGDHKLYMAIETIKLYNKIKKLNPDYIMQYNNDINHIHDIINSDLSKFSKPNKKIEYKNDEIEKFELSVEGYDFKIPRCTHDMAEWGSLIHNCIGNNYTDEVVNRSGDIIVGFKDGAPAICINARNGAVNQVLGYRNKPLKDEENVVFEKWCTITGTKSRYDTSENDDRINQLLGDLRVAEELRAPNNVVNNHGPLLNERMGGLIMEFTEPTPEDEIPF